MKRITCLLLVFLMSIALCGCCLSHEWQEATCTEPKACSKCGKTEGEPLGHTWKDATCTAPKTCSVCGETEGKPLEHTWKDATCTAPKTCSACGETEGEPIEHKAGNWTAIDPEMIGGEEQKSCLNCGEVLGTRYSERESVEPREVITVDGFTRLTKKEFLKYLVSFLPTGYSIKESSLFADSADLYYNGTQVISIGYSKDYISFLESGSSKTLRELAPYLVDAIEPKARETDYYDFSMQLIDERLKYGEEELYTIPMSVGVCIAAYTPYKSEYVGDNYHLLFTTLQNALGM